LPDASYAHEIPKLNAKRNVCTVGYIRTDYTRKDLSEVCEEVARYAGWSQDNSQSNLNVEGIFLDETPNLYTDDVAVYLQKISHCVKTTMGILGDRMVNIRYSFPLLFFAFSLSLPPLFF